MPQPKPQITAPPAEASEPSSPVFIGEKAKGFMQRFAPDADTILAQGGVPRPLETPIEPATPPAEPKPGETVEPKPEPPKPPEKKPPGSNIPKILEDKKRAEEERDNLRGERDNLQKDFERVNGQIAILEKKVEEGNLSVTRLKEYEDRIQTFEKEREKTQQELNHAKSRLKVFDVSSDPVFRERYIQPMQSAFEELRGFVTAHPAIQRGMTEALNAQRGVLGAATEDERIGFEERRDTALEAILDGMPSVRGGRLRSAFEDYIKASTNHAAAQADHDKTAMEVEEESGRRTQEAIKATQSQWLGVFDSTAEQFAADLEISPELGEKMKELGIEVDIKALRNYGRATLRGELNQAQTVELIHQGCNYKVVVAKNKALEATVAGMQKTIEKLRGASPPPGEGRSGPTPKPAASGEVVNPAGLTRGQFNKQFQPPGR